jgi:uncharacterized membrane protein YfcA
VASVAGFGIGSLVTPALAVSLGTRLAVTLVAIPHLVATAYRLWLWRRDVDRGVLIVFGLASAVGGLIGALLHGWIAGPLLTVVLGALLVFAGVSELTGLARRVVLGGLLGTAAGALSGLFGGLVGNQGGIRAAALLRFDLSGRALVATSTATGVLVDLARVPVYVATGWDDLVANATLMIALCGSVLVGTVLGAPLLRLLPEQAFRRVLAVLVIALGLLLIATTR